MESKMLKFVQRVLSKNTNLENITKAELRKQFLKEMNICDISKSEKKKFSSIVNKVLLEQYDAKSSAKHSGIKSVEANNDNTQSDSKSKPKAVSSADESYYNNDDSDSDPEALVIVENPTKENVMNGGPPSEDLPLDESEDDKSTQDEAVTNGIKKQHLGRNSKVKEVEWSSSDEEVLGDKKVKEVEWSSSDDDVLFDKKSKHVKMDENSEDRNANESEDEDMSLKLTLSSDDDGDGQVDKCHLNKKRKALDTESDNSSDGEKTSPIQKKKKNGKTPSSSEDEEIPSPSSIKENINGVSKRKAKVTPMRKNVLKEEQKKENDELSSSEDESGSSEISASNNKKKRTPSKMLVKKKNLTSPTQDSDDDVNTDVDSSEENVKAVKKIKMQEKTSSKSSKKPREPKKTSASNAKIEKLKKYLRVAGIRLKSYNKIWENCNTLKSKAEKLLQLLQEEGLKGTPTLEKCKKLKKKIERKKEIQELDVSNIIVTKGRPKRNANSLYLKSQENCEVEEDEDTYVKKQSRVLVSDESDDEPRNAFHRLQGIIDSEESD